MNNFTYGSLSEADLIQKWNFLLQGYFNIWFCPELRQNVKMAKQCTEWKAEKRLIQKYQNISFWKCQKKLFWKCLNASFKNFPPRWNISAFLNPNITYLARFILAFLYQSCIIKYDHFTCWKESYCLYIVHEICTVLKRSCLYSDYMNIFSFNI